LEVYEKRNLKEMEQFNNFEQTKEWDYKIVNYSLEDSIRELKNIIIQEDLL
jgi:guanylate kinase